MSKNLSKKKILKFEDNNLMQIMCGAYHSNLDVIEKCFEEKGYTTEENGAFFGLQRKKIRHKISIQLYTKCKDYYEHVDVPTTIVYFDEVRKSKKKEKVGIVK